MEYEISNHWILLLGDSFFQYELVYADTEMKVLMVIDYNHQDLNDVDNGYQTNN